MPHALFLPMLVYKSKDDPGSSRKGNKGVELSQKPRRK